MAKKAAAKKSTAKKSTKKTTKNKRHLRGAVDVHERDMGHIKQMLPFAGL